MPWIGGNYYLNQSQMENNALLVAQFGYQHGWTKNAISAMLGNMQAESGINPGIWEELNDDPNDFYNTHGRFPGYGLTQWTPYTKYASWAVVNGYDPWQNNGPGEMARIAYEEAHNEQWSRNDELGIDPPITLTEFMHSTDNINTLSNYWLWFYEHPADPGPTTQAIRQANTNYWFNFIPDNPLGTIPVWLLFKFNQWRRS